MPRLFEIVEEVDDLLDEQDEELAYGTSWAFDFIAGDFVTVAGKVPRTVGHRAWVDRCIKAMLTERYAWLAYTDDFGVDFAGVQEADSIAERETVLENAITDALEADPETGRVYGFTFGWSGDSVLVSCTVEPTIGTPEQITVDLSGRT